MVWIYTNTNHPVGHPEHLKVFATPELADVWFAENDREGVAFGYEVVGGLFPVYGSKPIDK